MKKILSVILTLSLICANFISVNAAYTDTVPTADYYTSSLRLQDLDILSGYDDGSFRPDNTVTRAEFTKIIVCMMDKETEAAASGTTSGFSDISFGSWFTPYVNYAVSLDILSGYSDGSFRPDNTITFAEAVTILMRTLGYSESDVGFYWPTNYISAAASLGLTKDMAYSPQDPITRAGAAILVDRALFTKPSPTQHKEDTYLETVGYTVLEDSLILDNDEKSGSVNILSGNLKLSNSTSYIKKTQLELHTGDVFGYAVIDRNGYLKTVREYSSDSGICSVIGAVNKLTENTIEYTTTEGLKGSYRADDNFIIYYDNSKLNFAQAKSRITSGIDIAFYGNSYGLWNIAVVGGSDSVTPVLADRNFTSSDTYIGTTPIKTGSLTVYRNGEAATLSDIKSGDVIYYNTKTNIMDVYCKKITGTYYSAYPSKAYVESVTVGGKSYEIGYSAATSKLDASSSAFNIGDKITLLLGKDDKIAFVTDNTGGFDYSTYGVVVKSGTRVATEGANDGSSEFVTTLFMTDGENHDIVTDRLYDSYIGDFVSVSYSGGTARLMKSSGSLSGFAGKIDKTKRTINGKYFLKDAVIIQNNSEDTQAVNCEIVNFDNLSVDKIDSTQILNAVTANSFDDIAILYVKNLENTSSFGVVTGFLGAKGGSATGYTIFSNGTQITYSLGNILPIYTALGAGVQFKTSGGMLTKILPLQKINTSSSMRAVENGRIMIGSTVYTMADNIQIFDVTDTDNIRAITVDDLSDKYVTSVTAYSDKKATQGGLVRILSVTLGK